MLKWVFGADTSPFRRSLNEMRSDVQSFSGSATRQIAGMFGGAALVAGAGRIIEKFARIKDLADRFGESSESIQRVGAAAGQAGTDIEGVAKGMTIATKNAVSAANGNEDLSASFERLGINAAEFANMPIEKKLLALNDGYINSSSSAQGLSDIMKVMGKSGAESIPLLTQAQGELKAQMDATKVSAEGVVKTMAVLDDQFAAGKQTVSVWAAYLISAVTSITTSWSLAWGGVFDIIGDGFDMIVRTSQSAMKVLLKASVLDFAGAGQAAKEYFQQVRGGLDNMVSDAVKAGTAVSNTWKDNMGGDAGNKTAAPDIENAKAAAEAKIEAAKEQMDLAKQIADLEEKARLNQLSLSEKILDAEKRRAALAAKVYAGGEDGGLEVKRDMLKLDENIFDLNKQDAEERLRNEEKIAAARKTWNALDKENKRAKMSDDDKIKSLRAEQKELNKGVRQAEAGGDKVKAVELGKESWSIEDRIKDLQAGIDEAKAESMGAEKTNRFEKLSNREKIAELKKDRDATKREAAAAFKEGDTKTGFEKNKAVAEITGRIDGLTSKSGAGLPTILTEDIRKAGGGGRGVLIGSGASSTDGRLDKVISVLNNIDRKTGETGGIGPEPF
ncbi:MAG: hypothetical protein H8M99_06580 [Gloeobacteraceae cyanobacterium ES-bin-144]|nr:hypothetical protein [Verrucomicrobiales bacterium]